MSNISTIVSPYIVRIYRCFQYDDFIVILMEFISTDLFNITAVKPKLDENQILRYCVEIALALKGLTYVLLVEMCSFV